MVVRLAIRMGYHQDPDQLTKITPFHGEMRRRTWLVLRQFDLLGAWQHGLPTLIRNEWSSTKRPRNLLDTDFDEGTLLPPARPDDLLTVVLWEIAKDDMYKLAAEVLDEQLSQTKTTYARVKQLDKALRDARDALPTIFKYKVITRSLADPADLILMRIKTETLYQKSLCVLHRNSLKNSSTASWSRSTCAESAMALLENLNEIFEECQPGGQLASERWMVGSIHLSDFFLGATVLCWIQSSEQQEQTATVLPEAKILKMNNLLAHSYQYCVQQQARSKEAYHVAAALRIILSRLKVLPAAVDTASANMTPKLSAPSAIRESAMDGMSMPTMPIDSVSTSIPDLPIDNLFESNQDIDWVSSLRLLTCGLRLS